MSYSLIFIAMDFRNTHYRAYVYTGFKMGKSVFQLHEELQQVFGQTSAPSLRTVRRWVADIRNETFTLEKPVSSGRPRHIRTPDLARKVEDLIEKDPRLSTRDLAGLLDVHRAAVNRILTEDLGMKSVCSVWVPTLLSEKNKKDRVA